MSLLLSLFEACESAFVDVRDPRQSANTLAILFGSREQCLYVVRKQLEVHRQSLKPLVNCHFSGLLTFR
jgi:hypothetical protein